ncbi:MAG TPA: branched-chain amino acid aminotransferase [Azospirillaceae bacterium]|nr:branched-chain amino acid aminotransferase [Azospirillaceae bacterium]
MSIIPFHDRDGVIWFDGEMVPWRDAKVHVLTHGLHYGSCVFEGERVYNGNVFKLREHSQRLIDSAEILGFTIPYSVEEIDRATEETVKAMKLTDAYVRPVAWRGSEMMGVSAQHNKIHLAIAVWEWPSYFSPEAKMAGIKLKTSPWKRPAPDTAPTRSKAAGLYMICTMSKHWAENQGFQDALMMDYRGQVAEATGANFFMVVDGVIHTPTPDCFLDGITRRTVIDLAKRRGYKVVERAIFPDEIKTAQEIFLTGTAAEVTPVGLIDDLKFTPGEVCRTLMTDYDALVRGKLSDAKAAE